MNDLQKKHAARRTFNALISIRKRYKTASKNTLVIGDCENDVCIIKKAGLAFLFVQRTRMLELVADYVIRESDSNLLIPVLT